MTMPDALSLRPKLSAGPPPAPRIALVDLARGLALVAMGVFHFAWDLSFLGFIRIEIALEPGWRLFSASIASSFLALAGFSLALAHGLGFRREAFWRRFGIVAGAALLVTLATRFAMPPSYVLFGILHCIAAGSLLCQPLLGRPWWLAAIAAAFVGALPHIPAVTAGPDALEPSFAFGLLQHLGLTSRPPVAVDFVPIFPWASAMLAGLALGLLVLSGPLAARLAAMGVPKAAAPLIWAGRRSLPIYLAHQPILIGALMLAAWAVPGLTPALATRAEERFRADCVMECRTVRSAEICAAGCNCILDELRKEPERHRRTVVRGESNRASVDDINEAVKMCFRPAPSN